MLGGKRQNDLNVYLNDWYLYSFASELIIIPPLWNHPLRIFSLKINNIELYNINGQLISAYLYSKNLEIGILNQGQYFLKFHCKSGNIYKSLIVK